MNIALALRPAAEPLPAAFQDVQCFWAAVDASERHRLPLEDALDSLYLSQAGPALAHLIAWTDLTAASLAEAYCTHAAYYHALRLQPERLQGYLGVDDFYQALRAEFPEAVPAQVSFVLGDFSCAGTVVPGHILLALEFFPPPEAWPLALPHLPLPRPERLPARLAHDLVHVQQVARHPDLGLADLSVLEVALLEGAAEYVGERLCGQVATPHAHSFGQENGGEVWTAFREEAHSRDLGGWFYGAAAGREWPADLGTFAGYELCRAYHEQHAQEARVVEDLIYAFERPERFLLALEEASSLRVPLRARPGRSRPA